MHGIPERAAIGVATLLGLLLGFLCRKTVTVCRYACFTSYHFKSVLLIIIFGWLVARPCMTVVTSDFD